jgi:hypothetical protein
MAVRIAFTYQATRDHVDAHGISRKQGETWELVRPIGHAHGYAMPDDIIRWHNTAEEQQGVKGSRIIGYRAAAA